MDKSTLQTVLSRITSTPFPAPGGGTMRWGGLVRGNKLVFFKGATEQTASLSVTFEDITPTPMEHLIANWEYDGEVNDTIKRRFYESKVTIRKYDRILKKKVTEKVHHILFADSTSRVDVVAGLDPLTASLVDELLVTVDAVLREIMKGGD